MHTRKDQRDLTAAERRRFVAAVLELKRAGRYDRFVRTHIDYYKADGATGLRAAHMAPSFLPWHRQYLLEFERELREVDPAVTVPYWDWTRDRSPVGPPWGEDFMGGNGRRGDLQVTTGPFAYAAGTGRSPSASPRTASSPATSDARRTRWTCPRGRSWPGRPVRRCTTRSPGTRRAGAACATGWRAGGRAVAAPAGATTTGCTAGWAATCSAPRSTTRCSGCTTPSLTWCGRAGSGATRGALPARRAAAGRLGAAGPRRGARRADAAVGRHARADGGPQRALPLRLSARPSGADMAAAPGA